MGHIRVLTICSLCSLNTCQTSPITVTLKSTPYEFLQPLEMFLLLLTTTVVYFSILHVSSMMKCITFIIIKKKFQQSFKLIGVLPKETKCHRSLTQTNTLKAIRGRKRKLEEKVKRSTVLSLIVDKLSTSWDKMFEQNPNTHLEGQLFYLETDF